MSDPSFGRIMLFMPSEIRNWSRVRWASRTSPRRSTPTWLGPPAISTDRPWRTWARCSRELSLGVQVLPEVNSASDLLGRDYAPAP
jgi:hypothetical protein